MLSRAVQVAVVCALALPAPAHAQRREGTRVTTVFNVELPVCVKFGEVSVPARRYRLTLGPKGFALADPSTMLLVATVPVTEKKVREVAKRPAAIVERKGRSVSIVLHYGDRVYVAAGAQTTEPVQPPPAQVVLAGKHETMLQQPEVDEQSERALVERALKRYIGSVRHCADGAHRGRWGTDDPRFVKCVCPIVEKWRLPRVSKPLRIHQPLAKGRSGFSLTSTTDGRAIDCRVWTGATSPEQQSADKAAGRIPAPESAVGPTPAPEPAVGPTPAQDPGVGPEPAAATRPVPDVTGNVAPAPTAP